MSDTKEVKLIIPMLPDMELAATKLAEAMAEHMKMDEEKKAEVSMAIIEACINAFEHSDSDDRNVYITFSVEEHALRIEIKDKGHGFDKNKVKVPDIKKKLGGKERKRGWGLHLMKELMDDVNIKAVEGGTIVSMVKYK